jgi:hypothetical protein
MKGDFSRLTFDPRNHFTQVFSQQGRVQLDADWNEQAAILRHYMERLAADLIGPYGGPVGDPGFGITLNDKTGFTIGKGHYYVDGLLVENPDPVIQTLDAQNEKTTFLVYLDVWERHITCIEDGRIREVALEGPDTATRAQVVWQVRVTNRMLDGTELPQDLIKADAFYNSWWVKGGQLPVNGSLKAQAKPSGDPTDPCVASPDALYRGLENQLYRVEVHTPGLATAKKPGATFKWSRDNGSVTFAITDLMTDSKTSTTTVSLADLGHEGRPRLAPGDWVEIVDDDFALNAQVWPLLQVGTVDTGRCQVTLQGLPGLTVDQGFTERHPLLRRWDQGRMKSDTLVGGAIPIEEGADLWIDLEDGVQVAFQPPAQANKPNFYRTGDYWLIPARTVTGDVEWPQLTVAPTGPAALPPHGVRHRYAPLALVTGSGQLSELRKQFSPLWSLIPSPPATSSGTTASQGTAIGTAKSE